MPETTDPTTVELAEDAIDTIAEAVAAKLAHVPETPPEPTKSLDIDALAKAISERLTPQRTELDEGGVKAKSGEPVFYGGDDQFTAIGDTDAAIATNLWLAKAVCEANPNYSPSPRLRQVMVGAADKALKAAPIAIPEYERNMYGGQKAVDPSRFVATTYSSFRADARAKALASTSANAGD